MSLSLNISRLLPKAAGIVRLSHQPAVRRLSSAVVDDISSDMGSRFIGPEFQVNLFGSGAINLEKFPAIPAAILSQLEKPCPFSEQSAHASVIDTHTLVAISNTLFGQELNLIRWEVALNKVAPQLTSSFYKKPLHEMQDCSQQGDSHHLKLDRSFPNGWMLIPQSTCDSKQKPPGYTQLYVQEAVVPAQLFRLSTNTALFQQGQPETATGISYSFESGMIGIYTDPTKTNIQLGEVNSLGQLCNEGLFDGRDSVVGMFG